MTRFNLSPLQVFIALAVVLAVIVLPLRIRPAAAA